MDRSVWFRWINLLLLGIPVVLFRDQLLPDEGSRGTIVLILAALSLIPLSGFLESAVDELEELLGEFLGGFLHTTFGNVAELAIALSLLLQLPAGNVQATQIVLGSIAGVIIRNSLLSLGLATVFGALKNGRMRFNPDRAAQYSTIFALAVTGMCLPTLASMVSGASEDKPLEVFGHYSLSLLVALVLLGSYLGYTLFAIFRVREGENLVEKAEKARETRRLMRAIKRSRGADPAIEAQQAAPGLVGLTPLDPMPGTQALFMQERAQANFELTQLAESQTPMRTARAQYAEMKRQERRGKREAGEAGEKRENVFELHPVLRGLIAVAVLAIAALFVVNMSEAFAKSVEELATHTEQYINPFFVGLIIIPLVGGAVEMYGASGMARRNAMEVVMGITAGASIQMILVVVPILVIVGHYTNHPLLLIFNPLEVVIFVAATFLFMLLTRDGESTILEGVQLCSLWALLAATAYFLPPVGAG